MRLMTWGHCQDPGVTSLCPSPSLGVYSGKAAVFILAPGDLSPGLAESCLWPWKLAGAPGTVLSFLFHLEMFIIPLPGQLLPCGKAPSGSARCGRSSLWGTHRLLLETRLQHFIKNHEFPMERSRQVKIMVSKIMICKKIDFNFCLGQMFTWVLPPVPVGIAEGNSPLWCHRMSSSHPGDVLDIQQSPPLLFHSLFSFRTLNTTEHYSELFHQPFTGVFRPPFSASPA